jgi:hypothetical protein
MVMNYVAPLVHLLEALISGKEAEVQIALKKYPHIQHYIASEDDLALNLENGDEEHEMGVIEHTLTGLGYIIAYWIYKLCPPFAIPEPGARHLNQMEAGWGFSNLTGAMFWHLFQLLWAQSRITRCRYCGSLIPNAHKNTRFCRNEGKCRNAYDNHSGRRAEQEAERKRRKAGIN